jgi:hypothetical protein
VSSVAILPAWLTIRGLSQPVAVPATAVSANLSFAPVFAASAVQLPSLRRRLVPGLHNEGEGSLGTLNTLFRSPSFYVYDTGFNLLMPRNIYFDRCSKYRYVKYA